MSVNIILYHKGAEEVQNIINNLHLLNTCSSDLLNSLHDVYPDVLQMSDILDLLQM